jgi:hypothetical protein
MMKKFISLTMAALMIFSGSLMSFAETASVQDPGYPMVEIVPGIDHTNDLVGPTYVNNNTGAADNGYVSITPLGGNLVKVHYYNGYYLLNEDNEPVLADLNSIYYKAANSVFLVTFSPILALDETAIFELGIAPHDQQEDFRPAVSHITTFDMNFTPPTELYGLISGTKLDEEGNNIIDVSFDFEVYSVDPDTMIETLVATAYSQLGTGTLIFSHVGDPAEYNELELPVGLYKLYEVNLPEGYEFVEIYVVEGGIPGPAQGNGVQFELVSDEQFLSFDIVNKIKDSTIKAFKYDAAFEEDTPFEDIMFDFELWFGDELYAIGESQSDGTVLFYLDWDLDGNPVGEGVTELELLYGYYTIKEINIPESHAFVKYIILADDAEPIMSSEGADPEYMFLAGDVDQFSFKFYNILKTTEITGFKYNAASTDPEEPGFTDVSFNFLVKDEEGVVVAVGHSVMDGSGKILFHKEWDENFMGTDVGVEVLVLPYGAYTIEEVSKTGYNYLGYEKYEEEILVSSGETLVVPFLAGDISKIGFIFRNEKMIVYKEDTAYAYPGSMSAGGTLNSVIKSKNWGWYINDTEGTFAIYAGAGQNDISKGVYVGDVTFKIVAGKYTYELDLLPGVIVTDGPHFGVYTAANKIPNGPGLYTNNITAAQAGVIVFHLGVKYPIE